jgi:lipoprotein-anchoring transpeptidase ErfK/SrfK
MRLILRRRLLPTMIVVLAASFFAAPAGAERAPSPFPGGRERACQPKPLVTSRFAYAAYVRTTARAYRRPGRSPIARFRSRNQNGADMVFGVISAVRGANCRPVWYRVQLPTKPNGIVGYVRARDVRLRIVRSRIVVDLSDRRVTLYRNGRRVVSATVAVGTSATPTPLGRYYVNQRLIPSSPYGPFGVGAIGISAFSEVLTGWAQGGPVAIHGTNQPHLLGRAVSNGCIRVHNDAMRRMFRLARSGTPVLIKA